MKIAIVGAGNIASRYAERITVYERLELVGATDLLAGRAEELCQTHGGTAYSSLETLLADPEVDTVVNLTAPQAHTEVTRAALRAGKHVHSEKPLALRHSEARELVELARSQGVRLSAAPATLLGEAQQTMWKLVRDGAIGAVRVAYAEANWGRLERWHPDPIALYGVGPLVDVGVYPITIVTAIFGPARLVTAYASTVEPDRVSKAGAPFRLDAPDFVVALLELEGGPVVRLTASFYVPESMQRGLELHGDAGSIYLPTWGEASSRVLLKEREGEYRQVAWLREPYDGIDWGRALDDLAESLEQGRPHRASGEQAAHVVEILAAIDASVSQGGAVEISSEFEPPEPLEWAR